MQWLKKADVTVGSSSSWLSSPVHPGLLPACWFCWQGHCQVSPQTLANRPTEAERPTDLPWPSPLLSPILKARCTWCLIQTGYWLLWFSNFLPDLHLSVSSHNCVRSTSYNKSFIPWWTVVLFLWLSPDWFALLSGTQEACYVELGDKYLKYQDLTWASFS